MEPLIVIDAGRPVSSWGATGDQWHDEGGTPRDRAFWIDRYLTHRRGRPPAIRPDQWDEAKRLRLLYHAGAVTAQQIADCLDINRRTCHRFLAYEVLWWL